MFKTKTIFAKVCAMLLAVLMILTSCAGDAGKAAGGKGEGEQGAEANVPAKKDRIIAPMSFLKQSAKNAADFDTEHFGVDLDITINISDDVYDLFADSADFSQIKALGIESVSINSAVKRDADKFEIEATALLNNKDIVDVSAIVDFGEEMIYVSVPTITSKTLALDFYTLGIPDVNVIYNQLGSMMLTGVYEAIADIDAELVDGVLADYITAFADEFEAEEDEDTIEAAGVSQDVDVLRYEITYEDLLDAALVILEKAEDDDDLKDAFAEIFPVAIEILKLSPDMQYYANNFEDADPDDMWDNMVAPVIEELIDEIESEYESTSQNDEEFIFEIYTADGVFCGAMFEFEDVSFSMISAVDGSDIGTGIYMEGTGDDFKIEFEGQDDDGVISGTVTFNVDYQNISFDIDRLDMNGLADGKTDVECTIDLEELGATDLPVPLLLKAKCVSDQKEGEFEYVLTSKSGKEYLSYVISASYNNEKPSVKTPSNTTSDAESWAMGLVGGAGKIIDNLEKAGVGKEYTAQLRQMLAYMNY